MVCEEMMHNVCQNHSIDDDIGDVESARAIRRGTLMGRRKVAAERKDHEYGHRLLLGDNPAQSKWCVKGSLQGCHTFRTESYPFQSPFLRLRGREQDVNDIELDVMTDWCLFIMLEHARSSLRLRTDAIEWRPW